MKYYTSDLHLDHSNMIGYCDRPFKSVEEMNEALIRNINETISADDDLYILGDFTLRTKREVVEAYVKAIHGRLHLIVGNHDYFAKGSWTKQLFASVDWYKEVWDEGRRVVLCHYPIHSWNGKQRGAYHLFGHVHKGDTPYRNWENAFNVGVDVNNYRPVTLSQLIWRAKNEHIL